LAEGIGPTTPENWMDPKDKQRRDEFERKSAILNYQLLWDELNEKRGFGWEKNPYVWVIVFRRL
jgi:hypothetical protein